MYIGQKFSRIKVDGLSIVGYTFSGGERQVKINSEIGGTVNVEAFMKCSDDVMDLMLAVDAIKNIDSSAKIYLTIPYLPYARQDRVCGKNEAFSCKVMAKLINSLECEEVRVVDPHSPVSTALIDRCIVISMLDISWKSYNANVAIRKADALVSPDAGAEKKVCLVADKFKKDFVRAYKKRSASGGISESIIIDDVDGKDVLVMDDICDGGRTFISLAKSLKDAGAKSMELYVTNGIFSYGFEELRKYYKFITCVNYFPSCFPEGYEEYLTVLRNFDEN